MRKLVNFIKWLMKKIGVLFYMGVQMVVRPRLPLFFNGSYFYFSNCGFIISLVLMSFIIFTAVGISLSFGTIDRIISFEKKAYDCQTIQTKIQII